MTSYTTTASSSSSRTVLVVGDWFIDEYWFISQHHSDTSSHRGPVHYRIVSEPTHAVRDLCGAGLTARVLYELRQYPLLNEDPEKINKILTPYLKEKLTNEHAKEPTNNERVENLKKILEILQTTGDFWPNLQKHFRETRTITLKEIINSGIINNNFLNEIEAFVAHLEREGPTSSTPLPSSPIKEFSLLGLGRWNHQDEEILPHFIHAHCQDAESSSGTQTVRASSSLKPVLCKQEAENIDITLKNLESSDSTRATTRCIRAYRFKKGAFEHIHRIDWANADTSSKRINMKSPEDLKIG
jgi:hypothetical protein